MVTNPFFRKIDVPRTVILAMLLAFILRATVSAFLIDLQFSPQTGDFEFGWELGRVAKSLAEGHGFSSPIRDDMGPTSWVAPLPAFLHAAIFKLMGVYSRGAGMAALLMNSVLSSLTILPLYFIGVLLAGTKTATRMAWAWCCFPYAILVSTTRIWGESLDGLLVTTLLWFSLSIGRDRISARGTWLSWFAFGSLAGLALLSNPNFASILPWVFGFPIFSLYRSSNLRPGHVALAMFTLIILVIPWLVRNVLVFGHFIPVKSNLWLEVDIANNEQASILMVDWSRHPASNDKELAIYCRLGERAYMEAKRQASLMFIDSQFSGFALLSLRKFVFWWTGFWSWDPRYLATEPMRGPLIIFHSVMTFLSIAGVALLRKRSHRVFVLGLVACQGMMYYFTHPAIEYRHSVEPLLLCVAVIGASGLRPFLFGKSHALAAGALNGRNEYECNSSQMQTSVDASR